MSSTIFLIIKALLLFQETLIGCGFGATTGYMTVKDDKGNYGVISFIGSGAITAPIVSVSKEWSYMPGVDDIFQLAGSGEAWGFSGGRYFVSFGIEGMQSGHYPETKQPQGITGSIGVGVGPIPEVHSFITKTYLWALTQNEMSSINKYVSQRFAIFINSQGKLVLFNPWKGLKKTDISMIKKDDYTWISQQASENIKESNSNSSSRGYYKNGVYHDEDGLYTSDH